MVVTNMPGAGSNAAVAHIYNVAPKDGTFIGAPQNSAIMDALFDVLLGNARQLAPRRHQADPDRLRHHRSLRLHRRAPTRPSRRSRTR